jgi:hypothetical protein
MPWPLLETPPLALDTNLQAIFSCRTGFHASTQRPHLQRASSSGMYTCRCAAVRRGAILWKHASHPVIVASTKLGYTFLSTWMDGRMGDGELSLLWERTGLCGARTLHARC